MKRTINFLMCGWLMITVIACTNKELIEPAFGDLKGEPVTVKAFVPGDDTLTRISYTDNGTAQEPNISMEWVDGDKFTVLRAEKSEYFTRISGTNDFEGTLPDPGGSGKYYAIYPAINSGKETEVQINLSSGQTGELNPNKTYMYAESEDGKTFKFKHITALLKPTFTGIGDGETVNKVTFTLDESTSRFMNLTDNTSKASGSNTYNISGLTSLPNYIYLPPMAVGKQINVVVTTNVKTYSATLTVKKAIEAGKIYTTTITLTDPDRKVWISGLPSLVPSGEGTEESPYLIDNAYHLEWMRIYMFYYKGKYFKLTSDLSIEAMEGVWVPNDSRVHIDGNGKTISGNMTFKKGEILPVGLISKNSGTVKNLIMDVNVVGTQQHGSTKSGAYIGAIAGVNEEGGVITGCINKGKVTGNVGSASEVVIGGIAGQNKGMIIGCQNKGDVIGQDISIYSTISGFTGGIVGQLTGGSVVDCVNDGDVKGGEGYYSLVGGIVGKGGMSTARPEIIEGCINNGSVYGSKKGAKYNFAGGIIGGSANENGQEYLVKPVYVFGCVNNGQVFAGLAIKETTNEGNSSACGLVGRLGGETSSPAMIVACANTGTVTPVGDHEKNPEVTYIVNDLANPNDNYVGKALWKGGQTYSKDNANDQLYTLVKGSVKSTAIADMNSAISSYNSSAGDNVQCGFVWQWTSGDWPKPVKPN